MRQLTLVVAVVNLLGVLTGCTPEEQHQPPVTSAAPVAAEPTPEIILPESKLMQISESEVVSLQGEIVSLLENTAKAHPCTPVRDRTKALLKNLKSGKAGLAVAPMATGQVVAFTKWDKAANMPIIVFAGPVLQQKFSGNGDAAVDEVIVVICHESLHIETSSPEEWQVDPTTPEGRGVYVAGEAEVWARQIVEITRPMMKAGRWVDEMSAIAEREFARCGNKNNDGWRKWVAQNLCVPE